MCARCVDGWATYSVSGEYITSDFCECDEGHELKAEMNMVWEEHEVNAILDHEERLHRGE